MFTVLFLTVTTHALGLIAFGHFEERTPFWRRALKLVVTIGLSALLVTLAGPAWALGGMASLFLAGTVIHFVWARRNGIDPVTAEPRDRYYALRGWR